MPAVSAGQQVRGPVLREQMTLLGYTAADVTLSNSIDATVIPGLSVVVEPGGYYAIDGYIAYVADATPDIGVETRALDAADGHWTLYGLGQAGSTNGIGPIDARTVDGYGTRENVGSANTFSRTAAGGTSLALCCLFTGYLFTGNTGGTLQVMFTQATANAAATTVKAGSWLSAQKIGDHT